VTLAEEVLHLLSGLQASKASGPDQISASMLLNTASSIAQPVTQLFNTTLRLGRLPNQWKTSMVVPIAKSSAKSDPGNYRPISLTSILCKILEKHICGLIELHLSTYHPLSDHQWGFRAGRSTVDALLTVTQEWCSALDTGKEVAAVFF